MTNVQPGASFAVMLLRLILSLTLFALPLRAEQSAAAGRIEFTKTNGSCSAALVRPDVIVTAAHCAGDAEPGAAVFRTGNGAMGQSFPITRFIRHPLYDKDAPRIAWRFRFDIAIAELGTPVPENLATPLLPGDDALPGETLFIVSWRGEDGEHPRQRACPVIEGTPGLVTLGCRVQGGESGAPVLRKTDTGLELVAVISSSTRQLDQPLAQASDVRLRLPPLLSTLDGS